MVKQENNLRNTFDQVAPLYDSIRPGYPDRLFQDIIELSNLAPDGRILEVGCGTGQATLPFARLNYSIQCIELGENLAAIAQRNLSLYPNVTVSIGDFEKWQVTSHHYDLLFSATAFHWIDPEIRYQKAHKLLKHGGTIALFWNKHVVTEVSRGFFEGIHAIYHDVTPEIGGEGPPHPDDLKTPIKDEIERTNLFGEVTVRTYPLSISYDATSYINLLNTYSNHLNLTKSKRGRLFQEIKNLIETDFGGLIIKEYRSVLYVAHVI